MYCRSLKIFCRTVELINYLLPMTIWSSRGKESNCWTNWMHSERGIKFKFHCKISALNWEIAWRSSEGKVKNMNKNSLATLWNTLKKAVKKSLKKIKTHLNAKMKQCPLISTLIRLILKNLGWKELQVWIVKTLLKSLVAKLMD